MGIYRAWQGRPTNHETSPEEKASPRSRPITLSGHGLLGILAKSAKIGYQLGKERSQAYGC